MADAIEFVSDLTFVEGYQGNNLATGKTRSGKPKWTMSARFVNHEGEEWVHTVNATKELSVDMIGTTRRAKVAAIPLDSGKVSCWIDLLPAGASGTPAQETEGTLVAPAQGLGSATPTAARPPSKPQHSVDVRVSAVVNMHRTALDKAATLLPVEHTQANRVDLARSIITGMAMNANLYKDYVEEAQTLADEDRNRKEDTRDAADQLPPDDQIPF